MKIQRDDWCVITAHKKQVWNPVQLVIHLLTARGYKNITSVGGAGVMRPGVDRFSNNCTDACTC